MKKKHIIYFSNIHHNRMLLKKLFLVIIGIAVMGTSVSALIYSGFGADPCSCANLAVANRIGLPFWEWQAIINMILLLFPLFLDRTLIGFGTVVNMFFVGILADALRGSVYRMWLPPHPDLPLRLVFMAAGVAMLCTGATFYMVANLGVSPYDSIPFILTKRFHLRFRPLRIAYDMTAVAIGWLFSGTVGIATLLIAFGLGPVIHSFGGWIQRKYGISGSVPIGSQPPSPSRT